MSKPHVLHELESIKTQLLAVVQQIDVQLGDGTITLNQLSASIAAINNKIGAANGIAPLDGTSKVPWANLPTIQQLVVHNNTWHSENYVTQTAVDTSISAYAARRDNPNQVTKAQVGLGNVDNLKQEPYRNLGYNAKSASDAPNTYPEGISYTLGDNTKGFPFSISGVITYNMNAYTSSYQIAYDYANNKIPLMKVRAATQGDNSWGAWADFYTSANKPGKADVGLGNVDNVQQAPITHVGAGGTAHAAASSAAAGFMTAAQFDKLAGITAGANNYVHPTGDGNLHVPATGATNNNKFLKAGSVAGSIAWGNVRFSELTETTDAATDTVIGSRVIGDGTAPSSNTGTLTTILGWLANRIKAITGKSDWKTDPRTTLENAVKLDGDKMTGALEAPAVGSRLSPGPGIFLAYPSGGMYSSVLVSETGVIKIKLPVSWSSNMIMMTVDVYDYSTPSKTATFHISGYNYGTSSAWLSCNCHTITRTLQGDLKVRFGHDGTNCCIYIGETDTAWAYPQVVIRDVFVGFTITNYSTWSQGWGISISPTIGSFTWTLVDNSTVSRYAKDAGTLVNMGPTVAGNSNTIMMRDGNGRSKVSAPSAVDDIARLDTVTNNPALGVPDTRVTNLLPADTSINSKFRVDFKTRTTVDLPAGTGGYAGVITFKPYSDGTATRVHQLAFTDEGTLYYRNGTVNSNTWGLWYKIWNETNQGPGSGLNADLVDGIHGTDLVKKDGSVAMTGGLQIPLDAYAYYANRRLDPVALASGEEYVILLHQRYHLTELTTNNYCVGTIYGSRGGGGSANRLAMVNINTRSSYKLNIAAIESVSEKWTLVTCVYNGVNYMALKVPYLESPLVHGYSFTGYVYSAAPETLKVIPYYRTTTSTVLNAEINDSIATFTPTASKWYDYQNLYVGTDKVWHYGNVGAGSGLNADMLDGLHGNDFVKKDGSVVMTKDLQIIDATSGGNHNHHTNKFIGVQSSDYLQSVILLHPIYDGTDIAENYCMGTFHALRGGIGVSNRIASVTVTTRAAGTSTNVGTIESVGEAWTLVTCTYGGIKYFGIKVPYAAGFFNRGIIFTGYSKATSGQSLLLVSYFNQNTSAVLNAEINNSITTFSSGTDKWISARELYMGAASPTNKIWHAGNMGTGSGLNADLVRGLANSTTATINTVMTRDGNGRSQIVSPAVDADIANKGYVDSGDANLRKQRYHTTTGFVLGNNDWTAIASGSSASYSESDRGVVISGNTTIKIMSRIPIDPESNYFLRAKIKKKSGTGLLYIGAISLDNSYAEINTDQASAYNYFAARGATIAAGVSQYFEGVISGYNTTATGDHNKFDPEAKYFDIAIVPNSGGTGDTVVEWLEVYKAPSTAYVGPYKVWHAGNMGTGSGLNADMVDGVSAGGFMRRYNFATTADLDTVTEAGSHRLPSVVTNGPVGSNLAFGNLLVLRGDIGDTVTQLVSGFSNNKYYMRHGNPLGGGGMWYPWVELYHTGFKPTATDVGLGPTSTPTFAEVTATNKMTIGSVTMQYNTVTKSLDFNVV